MASKESIEAVDNLAATWGDLRMDAALARLESILDDVRIASASASSQDPAVQIARATLGATGPGFLVVGRVPLAGVIVQAFDPSPARACATIELVAGKLVERARAEAVKS